LLQLIQDPQATRQQILSRCQRGGAPLTPQAVPAPIADNPAIGIWGWPFRYWIYLQ